MSIGSKSFFKLSLLRIIKYVIALKTWSLIYVKTGHFSIIHHIQKEHTKKNIKRICIRIRMRHKEKEWIIKTKASDDASAATELVGEDV